MVLVRFGFRCDGVDLDCRMFGGWVIFNISVFGIYFICMRLSEKKSIKWH